ncbi:hypothetical protein ASD11_01420 [Aeromicrobium sp. Root495]|uniref:hypothetical protein n=1 Tax=Aeromicrobium sp. Root495 TaxID=1736550 RepID=UPI0006F39628|nr:hypothetical protein [Aeromicrobium sp. Root495]KQY58355.1 hypothetical protein ASD11_01420 [Aeromicrobium sp. Root495]
MSQATRGVIPMPAGVGVIPSTGQVPLACPVCAEHVALAEVSTAPDGIRVTIPADQHTLLEIHRSKFHPDTPGVI